MSVKKPTKKDLTAAYAKAVSAFMHRGNVTGVDIGFRYKDGKRTEEMAVRVHVKEKLPESALEAAEVIPEAIDGVPVDVIQAVYRPQADEADEAARRTRVDPIRPGVSISHPQVTAGTFGALVFDRRTGRPAVLSNWHVLVGSVDAMPGDPVLQPGKADGGRDPQDTVGQLERMMLDADGDAAVALLNTSRDISPEQWGTEVSVKRARRPSLGEVLEKSGRTTGVTRAKVDGEGRYKLSYSVGQVEIDGFKLVPEKQGNPDDEEVSSGGDSGCLWYGSQDHYGVGLHFAGETNVDPTQEHALACHLERVLDRLDVSLAPMEVEAEPDVVSGSSAATGSDGITTAYIDTINRLTRLLEQVLVPPCATPAVRQPPVRVQN